LLTLFQKSGASLNVQYVYQLPKSSPHSKKAWGPSFLPLPPAAQAAVWWFFIYRLMTQSQTYILFLFIGLSFILNHKYKILEFFNILGINPL
jgi:hypothetical protein